MKKKKIFTFPGFIGKSAKQAISFSNQGHGRFLVPALTFKQTCIPAIQTSAEAWYPVFITETLLG